MELGVIEELEEGALYVVDEDGVQEVACHLVQRVIEGVSAPVARRENTMVERALKECRWPEIVAVEAAGQVIL